VHACIVPSSAASSEVIFSFDIEIQSSEKLK